MKPEGKWKSDHVNYSIVNYISCQTTLVLTCFKYLMLEGRNLELYWAPIFPMKVVIHAARDDSINMMIEWCDCNALAYIGHRIYILTCDSSDYDLLNLSHSCCCSDMDSKQLHPGSLKCSDSWSQFNEICHPPGLLPSGYEGDAFASHIRFFFVYPCLPHDSAFPCQTLHKYT